MTIGAIGANSVTAGGRANLVSNFETFLQLLTTQLKNQDPLSPLDSNDFTAQLTQMAGVEQQLLTNDLLQALVNQGTGGLDSAVHYIGKEVVAAGSAVRLDDGGATWSYELATNAGSATLEVLDSPGAGTRIRRPRRHLGRSQQRGDTAARRRRLQSAGHRHLGRRPDGRLAGADPRRRYSRRAL